MEADVEIDTKISKRMEDAAADRVKSEDSSSARVDDGPTSLTSFGMVVEPLLVAPEKCVGDAFVNEGAKVPKPHLPPVEVRMLPSAAGGLLLAGTASAVMRTIFFQTPLLRSFCLTNTRTSWTNFNGLASPCWRKTIATKSR